MIGWGDERSEEKGSLSLEVIQGSGLRKGLTLEQMFFQLLNSVPAGQRGEGACRSMPGLRGAPLKVTPQ